MIENHSEEKQKIKMLFDNCSELHNNNIEIIDNFEELNKDLKYYLINLKT